MGRSARVRVLALRAIGVFFGLAALYHLGTITVPSLADGGSPGRHGVFVAINCVVALGLFTRETWFFWFFTALSLQQLHSHGWTLVRAWTHAHRVDWQSVLVLLVVPVTWALLVAERRSRASH